MPSRSMQPIQKHHPQVYTIRMTEQPPKSEVPSQEVDPWRTLNAELEALYTQLGFVETDKLTEKRLQLVAAMASGDQDDQSLAIVTDYQIAGETLLETTIDGQETDRFIRGQIGFILAQAKMFLAAGLPGLARSQLEDAFVCANNSRYDDIATQINTMIDSLPTTEDDQLTGDISSSEDA